MVVGSDDMSGFFAYESPYRTQNFIDLTVWEYTLPFVVLIGLVYLLYRYQHVFRDNQTFERRFRMITGGVFAALYISHYALRYALYGWDTILLPFQLCSISMFLALVLIYTKNKTIYTFVLFAGVLGGIVSLFTPIIGYDSGYYRYYQFYGAHLLLILTPIYFLLVHDFYPTAKTAVRAFVLLQGLALFMGVFNYVYGTDFMFLFVDSAKEAKFPMITRFGGAPYYIIWMELVAHVAWYLLYKLTTILQRGRAAVADLQYKNA